MIDAVFSAVKDSKIYAQSTLIGVACNVVINFIVTPVVGVTGDAIATARSYFFVWSVRLIYSKKYIRLKISLICD